MPCDYSIYPPNWRSEIRPRILHRAGNKCELCGAENGATGYRDKGGKWYDWKFIEDELEEHGRDLFDSDGPLGHCFDKQGNPTHPTKIVLTIAHWYDQNPANCADGNLKAACQYCHLKRDKDQHQTNARLTRERKAGLQRMF